MELGRLDEETTANVGLIAGGTSGNVVPGHCGIVRRGAQPRRRARGRGRRARSPTPAPGAPASTAATSTCGSKSCSAATSCRRPRAALALAEAGLRRRRARAGSGSRPAAAATPTRCRRDGFDCVLLANGTDAVHTADETVAGAQPRQDARGLRGDRRRGRRGAGVSGRLKLRRGVVVADGAADASRSTASAGRPGPTRRCSGEMREGDEVVVNVAALDLGLGSGGFDVVHVNLTRGLEGGGEGDEHVMKLNYTSLQHPVEPVERPVRVRRHDGAEAHRNRRGATPVLVLPLHGHLAPAAWAAAQARPGLQGRLRADRRRGAAGVASAATSPSCASAACSAATSPPPPPTAASTRRSRSPAPSTPPPTGSAGTRSSSAPGPGSSAPTPPRPRRHGRPRQRPRRARPGPADPALAAPLLAPTPASATAASATTP